MTADFETHVVYGKHGTTTPCRAATESVAEIRLGKLSFCRSRRANLHNRTQIETRVGEIGGAVPDAI